MISWSALQVCFSSAISLRTCHAILLSPFQLVRLHHRTSSMWVPWIPHVPGERSCWLSPCELKHHVNSEFRSSEQSLIFGLPKATFASSKEKLENSLRQIEVRWGDGRIAPFFRLVSWFLSQGPLKRGVSCDVALGASNLRDQADHGFFFWWRMLTFVAARSEHVESKASLSWGFFWRQQLVWGRICPSDLVAAVALHGRTTHMIS